MVYPIDQRVIRLEEYGEKNFLKEMDRLKKEANVYDWRNLEWFDHLPDEYNTSKYLDWFFLFDNDEPVAFSTIQSYYPGCYRVLTRTYVYRKYRRFTHPKDDQYMSPTICMLLPQIEYLNEQGWHTIFASMQSMKRYNTIRRWKKKAELRSGLEWHTVDGMMQTCPDPNNFQCFQNVVYSGRHPNNVVLSYEEYEKRWPKKR